MDIDDFLTELEGIDWFKNSGIPNEKYHMIYSMYEAYDGWNEQTLEVWEPNIYLVEDKACEEIGDDEIDEIFSAVCEAVEDVIWNKLGEFMDRRNLREESGVAIELFDAVKRDICWACIERVVGMNGFHTALLNIYKDGYFPCSWIGEYPSGQAVVL